MRSLIPRSFLVNNQAYFLGNQVLDNFQIDLLKKVEKMYENYFDDMRYAYMKKIIFLKKHCCFEIKSCIRLLQSLKESKRVITSVYNYQDQVEQNNRITYIDKRMCEVDERICFLQRKLTGFNSDLISLIYYPIFKCAVEWIQNSQERYTLDTVLTYIYGSGVVEIPSRFSFFKCDVIELSVPCMRKEISFHPILIEIERRYISFYPVATISRVTAAVWDNVNQKHNKQQVSFYLMAYRHWRVNEDIPPLDENLTRFLVNPNLVMHTIHFLMPHLTFGAIEKFDVFDLHNH